MATAKFEHLKENVYENTRGIHFYIEASVINAEIRTKIPKYSKINSAIAYIEVDRDGLGLSTSNTDLKMWLSDATGKGNTVFTLYNDSGVIANSYKGFTGKDMKDYIYSETVNAGEAKGWFSWVNTCSGTIAHDYYVRNRRITYDYTPPTYTISAVAGTGGTVSGGGTFEVTIADQTKTLIATPNSGYRFVKWVDSDGNTYTSVSVNVVISQNNISAFSTTKTYTAYFERIPYTITYNGNGATSGSVASQSAIVGNDLTLNANSFNKFCKVTFEPNYSGGSSVFTNAVAKFKGWEDHGTITANNGETFTYEQFDAPFYANTYSDLYNAFKYNKQSLVNHWANYGRNENRQCVGSPRGVYPDKAVVNSLAGDGGSTSLYAQWGAFSEVILRTPTRDGYKLKGWYTSASGGTKVGDGGDSYVPTGDITLYAQWEVAKIFIGTSQPSKIYLGTQEVKEVYVGTTKVYG